MNLYSKFLKIFFFKSKEAKWVVCVSAFVITIISVLMTSAGSIETSFSQALHETAQYDFSIGCDAETLVKYNDINRWNGTVDHIACSTSVVEMDMIDSPFYFSVTGLSGDYKEIYRLDMTEGRYPEQENEIVVDSKFIDNLNGRYTVGDEITLFSPELDGTKEITYKICGIFQTEHVAGSEVYAFCSLEGAMRAFSNAEEMEYKLFVKASGDSEDSVMKAVACVDQEESEQLSVNESRLNIYTDQESDSGSMIWMFRILGIFIGIVSAAVLYNMLQIALEHKNTEIGIVKSFGIRKGQLLSAYVLNLLLYLSFSMIIGLVMTILLEKTMGNFLFHQFMDGFALTEYVDFSMHFSLGAYFMSAAVVAVVFAFVYMQLIRKNMKMTPLEEIRGLDTINFKAKPLVDEKKIEKANVVSFIGERNLSRNKGRTLYMAFSLFVSAMLILMVFMIVVNIDLYDMDMLEKGNRYDYEFYAVDSQCDISSEIISEICTLESVSEVTWGRRCVREFWTRKDQVGAGEEVIETRVYPDEIMERICRRNDMDYAAYRDGACCFLLGNEQSEALTLYDSQRNEIPVSVDGILDKDIYCDYSGQEICLVMNEKKAQELFVNGYFYNVLFIKAADKADCLSDVSGILERNQIEVAFNDLKENGDDAMTQLRSIVCVVIYILFCVSVMTIVNLICNVNINIQLRKREYGILIALGMRNAKIRKLVISEILIVMRFMLVCAGLFAILFSSFGIVMVDQEIHFVRSVCVAVGGSILLYYLTYAICYVCGKKVGTTDIKSLICNE